MKRYSISIVIFIAFSSLFFSCKKSSDQSVPEAIEQNGIDTIMKAKVNNVDWTADSLIEAKLFIDTIDNERIFGVVGYSTNKIVATTFEDHFGFQGLANVNYNHLFPACIQYETLNQNGIWNDNYAPVAASKVITYVDSVNQYVSGNFEGKVQNFVNSKITNIKNGRFQNIHYDLIYFP